MDGLHKIGTGRNKMIESNRPKDCSICRRTENVILMHEKVALIIEPF
jgi:hypothetical protein